MRILVTGATGLIGCHCAAALLEAGHQVRVFVREEEKVAGVFAPFGRASADFEISKGDVTDAASVEAALAGCDGVVHCAGLFSPLRADRDRIESINVVGTKTVIDAAMDASITRMIFMSSMLALFPPAGPRIRAEDPVARPTSMYTKTKAAAERFVRKRQDEGAPITIVYPSACHGPNDPTLSTGPQLVVNALRDEEVLVTRGGLAYTDVRELASLVVSIFRMTSGEMSAEPAGNSKGSSKGDSNRGQSRAPSRIMAPSFFLEHADYHALLSQISGKALRAREVPALVLRGMGAIGDLAQRLGRDSLMTREAAAILTSSVPVDDTAARELLATEPISAEDSFRDLLEWLCANKVLDLDRIDGERID